MEKIKLTKRQAELLEIILKDKKLYDFADNKTYLYINSESKSVVIDYLSNYLMKKGLRLNNEPNELGFEIEELIDIFL